MKTLILFLDAISFSDFNKENFPFLYGLAQKEVYGPLSPVPSGYHTEYSMLSGCLPLKHNVWTWFYMKKNSSFSKIRYVLPVIKLLEKLKLGKMVRNIADAYINLFRLLSGKSRFLKTYNIPLDLIEKFEIAVDKSYVDHNPLPVPTFFDLLRRLEVRYVAMDYPTISDNKGTSFYLGKDDFKQLKKAGRLLREYPVVYVHVWNLDEIEHKYGLHSKEATDYMRKLDDYIKRIALSEKDGVRLVVFSDHGGCNVKKTKNIQKIIKKFDANYFAGSTSAQIWLKDKKDKEKIEKELRKEDYLVYDEDNIEKELFIPYKREFVGDILACVKPGEQIYPDFFRKTSNAKSMHGYTKKSPELNGIFIMGGFGLGRRRVRNMKLYDIVPTMLKAMRIKIPKYIDGKARI